MPGEWRTFGERAVYERPGVWFGQVDVGPPSPSWERVWLPVLRVPPAVSVALLDGLGGVLMIRRHRFTVDRWGWELPGGEVADGEDPDQAAARELEDQTGYRARKLERLVNCQPIAGIAVAERVVFIGRDGQRAGQPVSPDGLLQREWVPLDSVQGLVNDGQIWDASSIVGLFGVLIST